MAKIPDLVQGTKGECLCALQELKLDLSSFNNSLFIWNYVFDGNSIL